MQRETRHTLERYRRGMREALRHLDKWGDWDYYERHLFQMQTMIENCIAEGRMNENQQKLEGMEQG